ncbi:LuxR C-terminal-related transcriptional regulator [Streptomyces sp. NBC_00986]|uniref:LuxR C-terminal-related transcriptional regulator n=1 Tax=Streptomyces sp. NBC_00986 TaxID=2903702 RepID=UPI00386D9E8D
MLAALASGWSSREIAERLSIAPTTVKSHISSILTKIGARARVQASCSPTRLAWTGRQGSGSTRPTRTSRIGRDEGSGAPRMTVAVRFLRARGPASRRDATALPRLAPAGGDSAASSWTKAPASHTADLPSAPTTAAASGFASRCSLHGVTHQWMFQDCAHSRPASPRIQVVSRFCLHLRVSDDSLCKRLLRTASPLRRTGARGDNAWRCRAVIPAKCWRRCL